jgi:hypothetical protein
MTKEELKSAGLEYANKYLREMVELLLKYLPEPRPPALEREMNTILVNMASNIPSEWPKNEPEVGIANLRRFLKQNPDTYASTS